MKIRWLASIPVALGLAVALPWSALSQGSGDIESDRGVQELTTGPVHEAYAEPVESRPQPSLTVTKQPPDPIEESPPDQKPEGDDVEWIPGYWGWDEGRQDFIWVSGFWRIPPPGEQWVPGYWQEVEEGWQWVPGFWTAADQEQLTYVPPPPPTIDEGPSTPAPDENSSYVPGVWVYRESRFLWRPGYWITYQPGWVWVPAHYCRSPFGYVFVEGYWDHPLNERGLLFCPVAFARDILRRRDFVFTPSYVVNVDFLLSALFAWPRCYHYYFGDYFGDKFARAGFVPWVDYRLGRNVYDPNLTYYRHVHGQAWERGLVDLYTARREGRIPRPPHTYAEQQTLVQNVTKNNKRDVTVSKVLNVTNLQTVAAATPLAQVHDRPVASIVRPADRKQPHVVRLTRVPREQQLSAQKSARQVHQAAQQRRQQEARLITQGGAPVRPTDPPKTVQLHPAKPRPEQRPPVDKQPPKETRPPVEKQPPTEKQPPAQKQPPTEKQPPAQKQPPTEKKPPVQKQPPTEKQPPVQKQPAKESRPSAEQRPAPRKPPPPPVMPKHEERPIPKHEPPPPVRPPKQEQKAPPAQKKDKG